MLLSNGNYRLLNEKYRKKYRRVTVELTLTALYATQRRQGFNHIL